MLPNNYCQYYYKLLGSVPCEDCNKVPGWHFWVICYLLFSQGKVGLSLNKHASFSSSTETNARP